MLNAQCLFCKMINGTIKSEVIQENDHVLVIKDIHPKAPVHYLIIPKKHIEHLGHLTLQDRIFGSALLEMAQKLSTTLQNSESFNLIANNGQQAGQSILHLHFHFLSGRNIYEDGLSL